MADTKETIKFHQDGYGWVCDCCTSLWVAVISVKEDVVIHCEMCMNNVVLSKEDYTKFAKECEAEAKKLEINGTKQIQ